MLRDSAAIETLYKENRGLFNVIKNFITNFKKAVYRAFDKVGANSEAAKAILQYTNELQALWDNALVGAVHNQQGKGNVAQGEQIKNENVDKYGFDVEKASRANKKGELINEFHNALSKEEWRLFYKGITKGGYLARAKIGTVAPIVVKDKLIISERKYTGKDKHDYVVIDAYKLFVVDGDYYTLTLLQEALSKGDIDYDSQRIFSFVNRLNRLDGRNELLARYNRDSSRFDAAIINRKQEKSTDGIHGDSQKEIAGAGLPPGNQQKVQGTSRAVKHERAEVTEDEVIRQSQRAMAAELTRLRELLKMQGKK